MKPLCKHGFSKERIEHMTSAYEAEKAIEANHGVWRSPKNDASEEYTKQRRLEMEENHRKKGAEFLESVGRGSDASISKSWQSYEK